RRKLRAIDPLDKAAGQAVQGDPASSLERKISRATHEGGATYGTDQSIAAGPAWLGGDVLGTSNLRKHCPRQKFSLRQVNMTISMAFIAPALVKATVEGRLPRGIGVANLRDAPAEWSLQFERLGLAQP